MGAGFGRRFGSDKRLHQLPDGRSVAYATVAAYRQVFDHVRVVVRPEDTSLRRLLQPLTLEFVEAPKAHLGMGNSLAAGFADLHWNWAFVGLMDMPYIKTASLEKLKQMTTPSKTPAIIRPKLRGHASACHPIGWHADYFEEITRCSGDEGARSLLKKYSHQVEDLILEDPGVCADIDQLSDVQPLND